MIFFVYVLSSLDIISSPVLNLLHLNRCAAAVCVDDAIGAVEHSINERKSGESGAARGKREARGDERTTLH